MKLRLLMLATVCFYTSGCSESSATQVRTFAFVERCDGRMRIFVRDDVKGVDAAAKRIGLYDGQNFVNYGLVGEVGRAEDLYALRLWDGTIAPLEPELACVCSGSPFTLSEEPDEGFLYCIGWTSPPDRRPYVSITMYGAHEHVLYWLPPAEELSVLKKESGRTCLSARIRDSGAHAGGSP